MAARFLVAGGSGLWNNNNNWADVTGGASGFSFPVAADTVAFDNNSAAVPITVNVASACTSIIASGSYTGTLTMNFNLTVSSTVTFISGMTYAGTAGTLIVTAPLVTTLTSGGKVITGPMSLNSTVAVTITLADAWTVNGLFTRTTSSGTIQTLAGSDTNRLNLAGGLTLINTSRTYNGTALIVMTGTGTITSQATTSPLHNNLTINTVGTITFATSFVYGGGGLAGQGVLTYIAGTMDVTTNNSTMVISSSATLNTSGMTWHNVNLSATQTLTLNSALNITSTGLVSIGGTLTLGGTLSNFPATVNNLTLAAATWTLPHNILVNGNLLVSGASTLSNLTLDIKGNITANSTLFGSTNLTLTGGNQTWSGASVIRNNLTITSSGTFTVSGNVAYNTGILTRTGGTNSVPNPSILTIAVSTTLNTGGITWDSITVTAGPTLTLNSALIVSTTGTLSLGGAVPLGGTTTFFPTVVNNLTLPAATFTLPHNILVNGNLLVSGASTLSNLTLDIKGNITANSTLFGTTNLTLTGVNQTWSGASVIRNNLTITSSGTFTVSGNVAYNTGILTRTGGTNTVLGPSILTIALGTTLNTGGITWDSITISGTTTLTLNSALAVSSTGLVTLGGALTLAGTPTFFPTTLNNLTLTTSSTFTLPHNILVNGSLLVSAAATLTSFTLDIKVNITANATLFGSTNLTLTGVNQTWSGASVIRNNLTITSSGTFTVSGDVAYNTGTLTRTGGTNTVSGPSVLTIALGTTLNTGGITWGSVTILATAGMALTLNSPFTVGNTLTISGVGAVTFAGAHGFTVAALTITTTGTHTHILTQSITNTYTVTTALNNTGSTPSSRVTLASSTTVAVIFTVNNGATVNCAYLNGTSVNSGAGRTVSTFGGTFNGTINWISFTGSVTTGWTW